MTSNSAIVSKVHGARKQLARWSLDLPLGALLIGLMISPAEAENGAAPAAVPPIAAARTPDAPPADAAGGHAGHAGHMAMKPQKGVVSVDVIESHGKLYLLTLRNGTDGQALTLQSSGNGGKVWTKEQQIPIPQGAGAQVSRGADARVAKIGDTLLVMWMSHVHGAPHGAGPMVVMRSTDEGKSWTPGTLAADWPQGPHGFISLNADGKTLHAAWLDSRDGKPAAPGSQGLRYATSVDQGLTWSKNQTLDQSACACCWTNMRADKQGNLFVLYRDKQPSDMAIGVIDAKDHHWTRLSTVGAFGWDFPGCPHIGGSLAFKGNDKAPEIHAIVGTRKKEEAGVYHLKSLDGGKNWSAPLKLGDETSTHADIAASKSNGLAAVWDMIDPEAGDGSLAIYAATSATGANWSQPIRLSAKGASATHPRIIATGQGFLSLWTEQAADGEFRLEIKTINPGRAS